MTRSKQRLIDYLGHILEAIERIQRYAHTLDEAAFLQNTLIQDAVIRNIEIIGEASHNIEVYYPEFAATKPQLPLAYAYQMRNAVAHGYFIVDNQIIWNTIKTDLPGLSEHVRAALQELNRVPL